MIAARLLFILGVLCAVGAVNALAKPNTRRPWYLRPWWLFAMLTGELVPIRFAFRLGLVAVLTRFGALDHRAGRIGLGLTVLGWAGHGLLVIRSLRARRAMSTALDHANVAARPHTKAPVGRILVGNPYRLPGGIERIEDLEYMPGHHLDVYRSGNTQRRPAIIQIHGGSWRGGNRRQQARPLLHELARRGWIGVAASYPLVPEAAVEDQVIALKTAIAWLRTDGEHFGVDPGFVAITGGSAGGHLASLVALTPNRDEFQPGFEGVDTSVQAAVPFYGIYDLLNRNNTRDNWPVVQVLMRATKQEDEARYRAASPLDRVSPQAPPFLVVHGTHDSVVSIAEADQFVTALRGHSTAPVAYAIVPGATHGFDTVYSVRSHHVVNGVARFLEGVHREYGY